MANRYVQNRYTVLVDQNLTKPARRPANLLIPAVVVVTILAIGFTFRRPLADIFSGLLS